MKTLQAIFIIICLLLVSQAYSYEGYDKYPMIGNVIFPLTDVDVELSEISVLMERTGKRGIDTKVTAKYMLQNLSSKEINFNVAFPVESTISGEFVKMPDEFKVLVNNKTVQTSTSQIMNKDFSLRIHRALGLHNTGSQQEIRDDEIPLIMWEISFQPKEKKTITTTYTMEWFSGRPGTKSLNHRLSILYLWKGNIDKAYFRLLPPEELIDNIKAQNPSIWPKINIHPKQYRIKDNAIEWFFTNFKQEKVYHIRVSVDYRKPGVIGD